MGFSEQFRGQSEKGQLNITNVSNMPDSIADVPFYPHEKTTVDTSKIFCDDGRCTKSMSDIAG